MKRYQNIIVYLNNDFANNSTQSGARDGLKLSLR